VTTSFACFLLSCSQEIHTECGEGRNGGREPKRYAGKEASAAATTETVIKEKKNEAD
jgi:hypothetical protein